MKPILAMIAALILAGCADGPVTTANKAYSACLDTRGLEGCAVERAKLDAALSVADAQSRRSASRPPLVLRGYESPPQQPLYTPQPVLICNTVGGTTICQ